MSRTHNLDATQELANDERFVALTLENDEVVVYDREDCGRWIQSDTAVSIDHIQ